MDRLNKVRGKFAVPMLCGRNAASLPVGTREDGSAEELWWLRVHVAACCELLLLDQPPKRAKSHDALPERVPELATSGHTVYSPGQAVQGLCSHVSVSEKSGASLSQQEGIEGPWQCH